MEILILIFAIIVIIKIKKVLKQQEIEEELAKKKEEEELRKEKEKEYLDTINSMNFLSPMISAEKTKKHFLKDMPELKISSIIKKGFKDNKDFIVIDTETTGLSPGVDEIVEISAIKFIDYNPVECMTTLLKPKKQIPVFITNINHIDDKMVENSPKIENVMQAFNEFIKGFNLVGYNIEFDLGFLYRNGMDIFAEKRKFYDVLPIVKKYYSKQYFKPENYKLDTICEYLEIYRRDKHRATDDAFVTGLLFRDFTNKIIENQSEVK